MATRYWVGGGSSTNWSATGNTNWAATSGGANNASVPTTGDAVVFDASSGAGTSVMDTSLSLIAIDCNGFTGTLTQNSVTLTITGNDAGAPASNTVRFSSGMTYTVASNSRLISMTSTSGTSSITTNGKTLGALTLNGVGGTFQLADDLNVRSDGTITLTNGTFNANNFNVTAGLFSSNNSNTRVLTMGSGTWTMTAATSSTVWDFSTSTNSTINANTSTLLISSAAGVGALRTVQFGTSKSYNTVTIVNTGSTAAYTDLTAGTAVTIATLNLTAPVSVRFASSVTYTITNAFTWAGSAYNSAISIQPGSISAPTIAAASGSTIEWAVLGGITFSGNAVNATNSIDLKGNNMNGGSITGPSGGVIGVIGG